MHPTLRHYGLLCPWNSLGKNTGAGCMPSSRGSFQPGMETASHLMSPSLAGGFFTPGKPHIYAHIWLYRSVNTRLITTSQNSIPINKRMVKDGIYACSQLLCICINAAQINFNIMLSERLLIWDYLLCDSTYMKFRNRENKLIAAISRSWGMLFIIIMGVA